MENKKKIFEIKAEDIIACSVNIYDIGEEVKKTNGELRVINAKKFYEGDKRYAQRMLDVINMCNLLNIQISSDMPDYFEDGPAKGQKLTNDLSALKRKIEKLKKSDN